jgi:hypothetical protein
MKAYASLADLDQGFLQHTQSVPTPNETWEVIIVLSNVWKELDLYGNVHEEGENDGGNEVRIQAKTLEARLPPPH